MNRQDFQHEEVDQLLPWYANESLDDAERQVVSQHLDQCAQCRSNLTLLMHMKRAVNDHQTVAMVPEPRLSDLLDKIDVNERGADPVKFEHRWLIAVSVAILAVATAFLFSARINQQAEPQFRTVTSSDRAARVGYVMNLTFAPEFTVESRSELIAELGASVLAELDTGSIQVMVPMPAVSMAELDEFTSELLRRAEVQAVDIVALQLPVRSDN